MDNIFKRVSIRSFSNERVEDEKIEMLLRAAMQAPSGGNQQPWEFYVVKNRDILQRLAYCSPYASCLKEAAVAIVPCYNEDILIHPDIAVYDMSAAVENILLEAVEQDLGAVWLSIAPVEERMSAVTQALDLPKHIKPFAIVPLGYPFENVEAQDKFKPERIHYIK
jgi:nitroreductase